MEDESLKQIKEIFGYLSDPKTRTEALNAILSLTENEQYRKTLQRTEICKILLRLLEATQINTTLICHAIINLSAEEHFQNKFIDLGTIQRIITMYFDRIKQASEIKGEDQSLTQIKYGIYFLISP